MTTGKALNGKPLVVLCAIASLCGMFAGDVFAAGPTHATAVDVKGEETIPGGRVVLPMNDGWEFKWGKDKSVGEWKSVDLPHDAQFEQPCGVIRSSCMACIFLRRGRNSGICS